MKKFLSITLSLLVLILTLGQIGCNKPKSGYTLYAPDGAPSIALSKILKDGIEGEEVTCSVVSANLINAKIVVDKADFVVLPVSSATKLYKADKNNTYAMISVITHGNFYFISSFEMSNVFDLIGKVILIPQNRNTVPDLTIKAILKAKNISYVESDSVVMGKVALSYLGSGSQVIVKLPLYGSNEYVAYMPEPAATNLSNKKTAYCNRLSVQEVYDANKKSYPQAVLLGKVSVLRENPNVVEKLKSAIQESVDFAKNYPDQAVSLIKSNFSSSELPLNLSSQSVESSNIYWKDAQDEKQEVLNYIKRIREISENSIDEVSEEFFYQK